MRIGWILVLVAAVLALTGGAMVWNSHRKLAEIRRELKTKADGVLSPGMSYQDAKTRLSKAGIKMSLERDAMESFDDPTETKLKDLEVGVAVDERRVFVLIPFTSRQARLRVTFTKGKLDHWTTEFRDIEVVP